MEQSELHLRDLFKFLFSSILARVQTWHKLVFVWGKWNTVPNNFCKISTFEKHQEPRGNGLPKALNCNFKVQGQRFADALYLKSVTVAGL